MVGAELDELDLLRRLEVSDRLAEALVVVGVLLEKVRHDFAALRVVLATHPDRLDAGVGGDRLLDLGTADEDVVWIERDPVAREKCATEAHQPILAHSERRLAALDVEAVGALAQADHRQAVLTRGHGMRDLPVDAVGSVLQAGKELGRDLEQTLDEGFRSRLVELSVEPAFGRNVLASEVAQGAVVAQADSKLATGLGVQIPQALELELVGGAADVEGLGLVQQLAGDGRRNEQAGERKADDDADRGSWHGTAPGDHGLGQGEQGLDPRLSNDHVRKLLG